MRVRTMEERDVAAWANMRLALWPDAQLDELESECRAFLAGTSPWIAAAFIAPDADEVPLGFIELNLRNVAEGCENSPVPHVEGWYVAPHARRKGVGRALMDACEGWARERGFTEITSDTTQAYPFSIPAHLSAGFEEVERVIAFRKKL